MKLFGLVGDSRVPLLSLLQRANSKATSRLRRQDRGTVPGSPSARDANSGSGPLRHRAICAELGALYDDR
jgi:hypothetical protein